VKPATATEADVQTAADALLAEACDGTTRPTVSALAQRAGITRPTLYRNYPGLVKRFTAQAAAVTAVTTQVATPQRAQATNDLHDRVTKLRYENEQLRLHLDLYEDHIRRLTIQNTTLADQLAQAGVVTDLATRRRTR
jgi:AcrR family transcriptional regulator